jgi:hypothetical protein
MREGRSEAYVLITVNPGKARDVVTAVGRWIESSTARTAGAL